MSAYTTWKLVSFTTPSVKVDNVISPLVIVLELSNLDSNRAFGMIWYTTWISLTTRNSMMFHELHGWIKARFTIVSWTTKEISNPSLYGINMSSASFSSNVMLSPIRTCQICFSCAMDTLSFFFLYYTLPHWLFDPEYDIYYLFRWQRVGRFLSILRVILFTFLTE